MPGSRFPIRPKLTSRTAAIKEAIVASFALDPELARLGRGRRPGREPVLPPGRPVAGDMVIRRRFVEQRRALLGQRTREPRGEHSHCDAVPDGRLAAADHLGERAKVKLCGDVAGRLDDPGFQDASIIADAGRAVGGEGDDDRAAQRSVGGRPGLRWRMVVPAAWGRPESAVRLHGTVSSSFVLLIVLHSAFSALPPTRGTRGRPASPP